MSVTLKPSRQLDFTQPEPLSHQETCILTISNTNTYPVTYKVKTTAPKRYTARPNNGTIEAKGSITVTLARPTTDQADSKRVKFLIESSLYKPPPVSKKFSVLGRMWRTAESVQEKTPQVHKQKLIVNNPSHSQEPTEAGAPIYDTPPTYSLIGGEPLAPKDGVVLQNSSNQEAEGNERNAELILEVEQAQAEIERLKARVDHLRSRICPTVRP